MIGKSIERAKVHVPGASARSRYAARRKSKCERKVGNARQDTSPFDALGQIGAEEASIPVGNGCTTIAAQVEHVILYLEVLKRYVAGEDVGKMGWGEIWERVSDVTAPEWEERNAKVNIIRRCIHEKARIAGVRTIRYSNPKRNMEEGYFQKCAER